MTDATSLDALLAAQIAAEDAVLAQGLEVWSVADPATGEVVLHVMPNDQLPRGGMVTHSSLQRGMPVRIEAGAANTAA